MTKGEEIINSIKIGDIYEINTSDGKHTYTGKVKRIDEDKYTV
jgi:hypothetical protein